MSYKSFLILFVLILASPGLAAQDVRYRVELLVFTHLDHAEPLERADWLADYSAAIDLLAPPEEPPPPCPEEETDDQEGTAGPLAETDPGPPDDEPPPPDPNALFRVEEMGPEMQDAWRRLRLSAGFRPQQYLSWEQGSQPPFPEIRVHGEAIAFVDDPYADLRAAALAAELEAEAMEDEGVEAAAALDENGSPVCVEPEPDPFPAPITHFVLDGSASLVRSRFLHLELDLQIREPVFETDPSNDEPVSALLPPPLADVTGTGTAPPRPAGFEFHHLKQRRQVRSGRMEYFDSPVIGVLAWITPIELEDAAER